MTPTEGCAFVGAKLNKVWASSCKAKVCTVSSENLKTYPLVHREAIRCDQALAIASAIFAQASDEERPLKRRRTETPFTAVLHTLQSVIVPALQDFLYRGVFAETLIGEMNEVHSWLMREAVSWRRFQQECQPALVPVRAEVMALTEMIFEKALYTVHATHMEAAILGPIANFLFDLLALAPVARTGNRADPLIQQLAVVGSVNYRQRHAGEWYTVAAAAAPESAELFLSVSRSISIFNSFMDDSRIALERATIEPLIKFLMRKGQGEAATRRLLEDQIRDDLCVSPNRFLNVASRLFPLSHRLPFVWFVLPILRLCPAGTGTVIASRQVRKTQDSSGGSFGKLRISIYADPVCFFRQRCQSWNDEIEGTLELADALLDKFVAQTQPVVYSETGGWLVTRSSGPVLNAAWQLSEWTGAEGRWAGFGRAVALVLIMNGSVERLTLAPGFVKSLHTMQLEAETLERAEAIHFFNEGAVDVLGVLGFRVLSLTHLHALFGSTCEEA